MSDTCKHCGEDAHAAFYEEHYPDWTVHALPLMVYVPMKDSSRDDALTLVQETLDEGSWDIRVALAPSPDPADGARDAGRLSEEDVEALDRATQWHWDERLGRVRAAVESILAARLAAVEAERDYHRARADVLAGDGSYWVEWHVSHCAAADAANRAEAERETATLTAKSWRHNYDSAMERCERAQAEVTSLRAELAARAGTEEWGVHFDPITVRVGDETAARERVEREGGATLVHRFVSPWVAVEEGDE